MYVPDAMTRSIRENRAEMTIPSIVPGQTTRTEVYLLLGEPDEALGNQLVYRWRKLKFFLLLLGHGGGGGGSVHKECKLIITFDERGVVLEQKLEDDLDWTLSR